jgi:hypothetical protein
MAANSGGRPFSGAGDTRINHAGPFGKLPLGFAKLVREHTGDGKELLEFALAVLRADLEKLQPIVSEHLKKGRRLSAKALLVTGVPMKERLAALELLLERGWGKSLPVVPDEDEPTLLNEKELLGAILDSVDPATLNYVQERILLRQKAAGSAQ